VRQHVGQLSFLDVAPKLLHQFVAWEEHVVVILHVLHLLYVHMPDVVVFEYVLVEDGEILLLRVSSLAEE